MSALKCRHRVWAGAIALMVGLAGLGSFAQTAAIADKDLPNPYQRIEHYFTIPEGRTWGSVSAIDVDRDGTSIWVAERCGGSSCADSNLDMIFKFNASGHVTKNFGAGMFVYPHGIHVDRQGNVWIVDGHTNMQSQGGRGRGTAAVAPPVAPVVPKGMQVVKFSPDGRVLMRLGTAGVAGADETHFNQPSDVVTAANGDIFVADGHGGDSNARIVKFTKDGTFIKAWGHKGSGPGELDTPHSITIDSRGRLFVADRENSRVEIFDQNGTFIDQWKQFGRPSGVYVDKNDVLYATDSESNTARNHNEYRRGIHVGSARTGIVTAFIPDPMGNIDEGPLVTTSGAEGVVADSNGVIYAAQVRPMGLFKFLKTK